VVKKIERWDKLVSYGLVALALWLLGVAHSFLVSPQELVKPTATKNVRKVFPYGKIDGFFVYIVKGRPDDPAEPELALTLTPLGDPNCNIVWVLTKEPPQAWSFLGPFGCKIDRKSLAYYERKFVEALIMYHSGFDA
jgi:hypothetical protein